jgi:hypothetical protein
MSFESLPNDENSDYLKKIAPLITAMTTTLLYVIDHKKDLYDSYNILAYLLAAARLCECEKYIKNTDFLINNFVIPLVTLGYNLQQIHSVLQNVDIYFLAVPIDPLDNTYYVKSFLNNDYVEKETRLTHGLQIFINNKDEYEDILERCGHTPESNDSLLIASTGIVHRRKHNDYN